MKTWAVTIEARVRKTYYIEAEDAESAEIDAHEAFSVLPKDGVEEDYDEELIDVRLVDKPVE